PARRKRNVYDSPIGLTKMQLARQQLLALRNELFGIEETAEEMSQIMDHVNALQDILSTAKETDLSDLGIETKSLLIDKSVLAQRCMARAPEQIDSLCAQITRIHRFVSMQEKAGARMIMDAILLTVAELSADGEAHKPVAIFPKLRLSTGGIQLTNPATDCRVWLTPGNADYAVCTYANEAEQRHRVLNAPALDYLRMHARNRIIVLVEGKRQDNNLYNSMPD
ncbi:hypothetical protein CPB85DRAFT_1365403, partial [Mucidula mucida]